MQGRYCWVRDEWHALDTATSSHSTWNKGKPVANTSPLTTTAVRTKFVPQPTAVALHVSFLKPNLIPCDGSAKWSQDFSSSRLLETLSLVFMLANCSNQGRWSTWSTEQLIQTSCPRSFVMIKLLQASFKVTTVHTLITSVPKILSKLSWKFAHGCWKSSAGSSLWTPGPTKADRNSCNVKLVQEGQCRWTNSWFGEKGLSPHLAKLPRQTPLSWSSAVLAFGPLMSGKQCEIVP